MGWCSATTIFDKMATEILETVHSDEDKIAILITVAQTLEDDDWDCQSDSRYIDHPLVGQVFRRMHPDWDWEE